jgi:hypothetical protein
MVMTVKKITVEEWSLWRELRLQALEEAPFAFSSTSRIGRGTVTKSNDGDHALKTLTSMRLRLWTTGMREW